MPELVELCGGVLTPPFVKEVRPVLHESSDVYSPPCQALGFEKCGVDGTVSLSPKFGRQLAQSCVIAREVCDFLATLVVAFPGSAVGCWLMGAPSGEPVARYSLVFECLLVLLCVFSRCVGCVGLAQLM
jgi:hypothetical protein